jgi:hypothetical protein
MRTWIYTLTALLLLNVANTTMAQDTASSPGGMASKEDWGDGYHWAVTCADRSKEIAIDADIEDGLTCQKPHPWKLNFRPGRYKTEGDFNMDGFFAPEASCRLEVSLFWKPSYNDPDGSWIVRIDPFDPIDESDQIHCTVGRWNCRRGEEWCQRWDGDNLFAEPEVKTRGEGFYTKLSTKDPDTSEKVDKIYFEFHSPIYPNPICPNILWRMNPQPTNAMDRTKRPNMEDVYN